MYLTVFIIVNLPYQVIRLMDADTVSILFTPVYTVNSTVSVEHTQYMWWEGTRRKRRELYTLMNWSGVGSWDKKKKGVKDSRVGCLSAQAATTKYSGMRWLINNVIHL